MPKVKKLNEETFSKLHRQITTTVELIRARQEEKQALIDDFITESKRFFFGKISEKALMKSIKKTNKELQRLDKNIKDAITKAVKLSNKEIEVIKKQKPVTYLASLKGISVRGQKKAVTKKKKKK